MPDTATLARFAARFPRGVKVTVQYLVPRPCEAGLSHLREPGRGILDIWRLWRTQTRG